MVTWVLGNMGIWELGYLRIWELRNLGAWVIANVGTWNFGNLGSWALGNLSTWVNEYLGTCAFRKFGCWVHTSFKDNFIKKICNIGVAMATPATPLTPSLCKTNHNCEFCEL